MPSSLSTYDELRAARVRVVGTRFLQLRPWIAGAGAAANAALLASSGAPREQLVAVGASTGLLVLAFALEAAWLVRRPLSERWLLSTLVGTALFLGVGCALTGGARSPLLPLVLAPVVIAYAAFARGRAARWVAASGVAVVALLALDPAAGRMPPVAPSHAGWMALVSTAVALVLSRVGVAGLAEAQLGAGETVARMREALLADAAARARDADVVGARVAHEVRNPLTSIKGLVQLMERRAREGELGDARDAKRLEVVLEEVRRVESILDDYLQFARPLVALEPREVSLRALLDDVATLLEIEALRASVVLRVEGDEV
ncbi:MAG: hypothetical protein KC586_30925, partial [Myxococcales bacterium]|nr:hypothetical protein [Myxococcales bacterium]